MVTTATTRRSRCLSPSRIASDGFGIYKQKRSKRYHFSVNRFERLLLLYFDVAGSSYTLLYIGDPASVILATPYYIYSVNFQAVLCSHEVSAGIET